MTPRTLIRPLGAAAGLIAAVAVGLTACGESGSTPDTNASGASTATRPVAAVGSTIVGSDLVDQLTAAMTAAPGATVATTITSGDGVTSALGSTTFGAAGSGIAVAVDAGDTPEERFSVVQVPGTLYLRIDAESVPLAEGKDWVEITDVSGRDGYFSAAFGGIGVMIGTYSSPDALLRLTTAVPTLTVTSTDARGATYTAPVTSAQVLQMFAAQPFGADESARAAAAKAGAGGTLTLVVNAQGRPRSFTLESDLDGDPFEIATTYTGWGPAAAITRPPAASTVEAAEVDAEGAAAMGVS